MRITDEQKERAAFVNLPQFLMSHGFDLKKVGKEYVWKEHDSLHIKDNGPGERGQWFRFSENKGGDNIGLLREYMDMSFIDAVEALTGEHIDCTYISSHTYEPKPVQQTARELSLAEADNCRRVFAYLCKTRGLDYDMLSELVKKGVISQEEKTGNVLFKYFDTDGKVIGAEKVGTSTEHKFKGIATGSASGHGFEVVCGTGEKAFFFESAIDMLSYLQMHSKELDNCRLVSMMGVKPNIVLDTMLRHNIAPENVFLCSDNDTAGNEFAQRLQEQYHDMKRIITPDTYKDWNDMLRGIPKVVEQETEKKEVDSVADLITYGNKMWHKATDNRDKSLVTIQVSDFARLQEQLDNSGINYYAYARDNSVIMAINDKDMEWFRQIAGTPDIVPNKSNRPYSPPEKNIFGSREYRYIPQKEYLSADRDLVLKMAEIMSKRGMQFSGRVYPSGKGTLTVSHADLFAVRNIRDEVINMRKQFASPDKAQEVGNRDYRANRDTHYYMSKLTPEQFKEVKPFLETSVSYHAVSRDGKVAFAVDKENAPAFHRALENAVREVGMLRNMADLGLTMEQNVALSPVIHRLAVEDVKLDLADFFDNRYDDAQFGEMLSLVNAYLSQAPAERYGEHSKLNDMLEAKSSFDRSIELSDFFSLHDFSDEQRAAITAMFVGDVTRGHIDSIDETFTAEDIQAYDEILHNALQESDVADFLTAHKQAVIDRENASRVPTEEEVLFQQADLAKFLAERTLSSDEWEDMAYPLFDSGYLEKHKPSDKAAFGYHMSEPAFYDLAQRYHHGDDIRKELALGLLEGGTASDIEFVFEDGKMSDRTYYYAENLRHSLHLERTEDGYNCSFGGIERFVSFEEIGQAFIDRIHEEFDDLAFWWVRDDMQEAIPDISDEKIADLLTAFDGAAMADWEKGDNLPKLNRIKKALYDILGDESQTEMAFACIAKHKYNVEFEPEQPEKQPDSLTFRFGKNKGDEWVSESDMVHDFALAHPDCSFALGNAVLEYLDEKQHSERNIPELKAGWYKKTDFTISAVINGEQFSYEGRFDIGDGKGTGGGSLIDHIRTHNEGILGYTQHPFNQSEYQERAKHTLDVLVPFLEAHSELTAEEQRIFDDFKEQYPIRTIDDVEKPETAKVSDLAVGDIIMYDGARREIEEISPDRIKMKDLDAPDYGGILLGTSDVLAYDGWQQDMEEKGFEILSKAEKSAPAVDAPEKVEPEDKGPVSLRKVGDFYEMYGKNAEIGAEVFGLRMLSKNGSPMVGFPDHVKDEYSAKLKEAGYTVLIEQAFELNPPKREPKKLQTLQQVVDTFFGTDCESAETEGGTWRLAIADGDKNGELYYGGEPVCGIYNRGDKMAIEPYRELSTFPKLLQTAMLEHNPDKPVEIMDFQRTFETPLDKAKWLINDFCEAEYRDGADFADLHNVGLAFTTLTDDELPIQVTADLVDFKITYEFDGEVYNTEQYDSIEDMIENGLTKLDFSDLVSVPDEVIDRHTGKDEQTVELMSDASEVQDISPVEDVPAVTLKYKGDAESLDEIKDKALSLGATVIVDHAEGIISIDTYENHTSELDLIAYELGVMRINDASAVETPAQDTADIDKPLFTDAAVIDQIQRNEQDDVPFWEKHDIEGEQLSLFGDSEPLTASNTAKEKSKSEFSKGPVVDGVQVYEALAAEIDRGTGFVHGKLRVQDFYEEQHPTVQQLADFLKKEYGTGGHSGEGKISLVDYNSQGITFSFENGEKFRHSWYNVATMTEARLRDDTYLFAEQKAERAALKAEQSAEEQSPHTVTVGDRFRHKITGEISEVVSLTGALPFYTDDCTVTTDRGSYATTENISYDKLLNSGLYEYIGKAEPEKAQSVPVKPEPAAKVTTDKPAVAPETEKTDIPTIKNLSQLKKAIQPGMMFEITDHLRPECIGERRIVTGVSTVDFTSRKLDENGEPTGKDLHMEFDRAKNWTFDGSKLTSRLDNGDMLMSFHFIDSLERTKESAVDKFLPTASPWGKIESSIALSDGVYEVSVPAVGVIKKDYIMISADVADTILSPEALSFGFEDNGYICFSKDEDKATVFRELLDSGILNAEKYLQEKYHSSDINAERFNDNINETLANRHHDYWATHEGSGKTPKSEITPENIEVGDKFEFRGYEYEVYATEAYPPIGKKKTDEVTLGFFDAELNPDGVSFLNASKKELADEGVYLGNAYSKDNSQQITVDTPSPDKGDNFTITDDNLGDGGAKTKFRANIEAIKTLKTLEAEKRPATAEEKETLSKYVGWGALAKAFDKNDEKWSAEYKELSELLTPQEYAQARSTVNDAFYTSPTVIDGIYEALTNFGFKGGNVLEPAMGIGNFFGRMSEAMQANSQLYGVEIDSLSGRIAQALYPDADIAIQGFEKNRFQNGSFDVAVGNVPFGELGFRDTVHDTTKLHDYFFAEALSKLKEGGIMAFVTSAGTLDKRDETTRQMLADKADFIGAIRLPGGKNGAFKDNAGTEVTTDIIFLKKHEGKSLAEMSDIPDWVHIGETADGLPINKYFEQHPDMVLGTVVEGNKLYGSGTMVVAEDGFDLKSALHEAVGKLSAEISHERGRDVYAKTADGVQVQIPSNLRNYSFFMSDDQVFFKKNNAACEFRFDKGTAQHKRFKAFIELRDLTRELIEAMELDKPDSVIKDLQTKLNVAYDDFYKKYGIIHSQTNKRYFSEDVSYNLVAGLEKSYDKTKLLAKSDIFTKRTIVPPKAVNHVDTALEALTLSFSEKAKVDFEYMSGLTGMTEDELKRDLTGAIFKIPHTENGYQTASEYLSGDIRKKLREAEEIAEYDPDFNINVSALKQAMPEPLKAGDIDIKLGAAWLDPKYYEQFMYELLQTPAYQRSDSPAARWNKSAIVGVEYSVHANSFHVSNKSSDRSVLATQKYGTHKMNAYDIFEHLLNLQEPKVYKTIEVPDGLGDTKEKRVVDIDATRVVQRKADDIRKAFKAWIFKDPQRREAIVEKYNELFNSIRPREFDGSALSFPMMTSDIKLHDHQKNAIAHAMFGGNTLFAHCVGAGKTFEMIATAMESKRLGLCTKSLFAVPNHLTEQIGDDFQKLYPGANILVATKKDFQKANRQQLFAKIATGNYDAVIIGHSQLGKIPVSKERQVMTIQSQINDILRGIEELKKSEGSKFQIKAMERTRKSLQKQLDKLEKANQDDTLTFEQLGIDRLFVDEAHEFKNLFVATKLQNVAGISNSASQKALDLFLKCRYLDEKTGGKGVIFATGTPLSNSITELHTMMRYLEYDFLNDHGLQHFDNWVAVVTHPKGQPFIADEFPRYSAEVRGFCCLRGAC